MAPGLANGMHPTDHSQTKVATSAAQQHVEAGFDYSRTKYPSFPTLQAEREYIKERLALAYRVFANLGLCEMAAGHLTVRDPLQRDAFWVTPYGRHFAEMQASDLLLIDHQGNIIGGGKPTNQIYNRAAFVIHSAIHKARPDANAVCHSHSVHAKAFSALRRPLPFYTQDSCVFYNDVALYQAHGGVVLDFAESQRICKSLGDKKAIILANHGLLTAGQTIESATGWFIQLDIECGVALQVLAACGGDPSKAHEVDEDAARFTYEATGFDEAGRAEAMPYFELLESLSQGDHKL